MRTHEKQHHTHSVRRRIVNIVDFFKNRCLTLVIKGNEFFIGLIIDAGGWLHDLCMATRCKRLANAFDAGGYNVFETGYECVIGGEIYPLFSAISDFRQGFVVGWRRFA